jgi:hypothetical protein
VFLIGGFTQPEGSRKSGFLIMGEEIPCTPSTFDLDLAKIENPTAKDCRRPVDSIFRKLIMAGPIPTAAVAVKARQKM